MLKKYSCALANALEQLAWENFEAECNILGKMGRVSQAPPFVKDRSDSVNRTRTGSKALQSLG